MPTFPKVLVVRGVEIPAQSWEEVDEILERYGASPTGKPTDNGFHELTRSGALNSGDVALLSNSSVR